MREAVAAYAIALAALGVYLLVGWRGNFTVKK